MVSKTRRLHSWYGDFICFWCQQPQIETGKEPKLGRIRGFWDLDHSKSKILTKHAHIKHIL